MMHEFQRVYEAWYEWQEDAEGLEKIIPGNNHIVIAR